MLIYNQVYDVYHTMFRILQIMSRVNKEIEIDKLRILDFYLAFPSELLDIKSFRGFRKYEKYLKEESNKYERVINSKRLFFKMESIQMEAIRALVSYNILSSEAFKKGKAERTSVELSENLEREISQANKAKDSLISLLTGPLASMGLYGHLGLKNRTNLIEFKYDNI